ncbi:MAG: hypothetical protein RTV31_15215 [Candidatus Thorarchaeota archaeon]
MRIRDPPLYALVFYFILFSSLIIHELGHIYSAQYITKDCMFTETTFHFDLLVLRRSGMTYFSCNYGLNHLENPKIKFDFSDITDPSINIKVASAEGIKQLTSPLTTGWFTALMGPSFELLYITWIIHWLSRRYKQVRVIKASYLVFLFMVFVSSRMDFQQAIPEENSDLFIILYFITYMVVALTHISLNIHYYRSLYKVTSQSMKKTMRIHNNF